MASTMDEPMDFADALAFMNGRLRLGVKLGNDRFLALLERLGSPHEHLNVVHVAGTKGKGSVSAMCAAILHAAGYKTGAYFSPYVYTVRERVQIDGQMIPETDFARWVSRIKPHVEALEKTDHGATTEFEMKTAVGLCWLHAQQVDVAVLEVGLGGRLDATNVVPHPLVSAITTIGFDHTELLGHTLTAIAGEKAGIVKPGVPCVSGVPVGGEAWREIARVCTMRHAPLSSSAEVTVNRDGTLRLSTPQRTLDDITLGMRGAFQQGNAAVAVAALDAIEPSRWPRIGDDAMRAGLRGARLPGRLEVVQAHGPTIVVDGAHNEMAAEALAEALRSEFGADRRRVLLVTGMKRNHDPLPFLAQMAVLCPAVLVATEPGFQPRPVADIADAARTVDIPRVETAPTPVDAARLALSLAGPDDLICVTGSFYTVGDIPPAVWGTLLNERN